jgi:hypothetical protein
MKHEDPIKAGGFIKVEGKRVFYRSAGEGEPVVLLQGFPTSSYDWRKLLPPLSRFGRAVAPDLYGLGRICGPGLRCRFSGLAVKFELPQLAVLLKTL